MQNVVCTELHVIEPAADDNDNPRNNTIWQQTDISPSNSIEAEANEEPLNEGTSITTTHHDATAQADHVQETETSNVPEDLLDISSTPVMIAHATADFINQKRNNFLKGCKWYY